MKTKYKVFIDLPDYVNLSNGTKCIQDLTKKLESKNIKIVKLIRNYSLFSRLAKKLNLDFLNKDLQLIRKNACKGDWLLACDTT